MKKKIENRRADRHPGQQRRQTSERRGRINDTTPNKSRPIHPFLAFIKFRYSISEFVRTFEKIYSQPFDEKQTRRCVWTIIFEQSDKKRNEIIQGRNFNQSLNCSFEESNCRVPYYCIYIPIYTSKIKFLSFFFLFVYIFSLFIYLLFISCFLVVVVCYTRQSKPAGPPVCSIPSKFVTFIFYIFANSYLE